MSDNTFLRVALAPRPWSLLEAFNSVPDKFHKDGGLQLYRRKWKEQIDSRLRVAGIDRWGRGSLPRTNPELCYLDLDEVDVAFVRRTIGNAHGGGFQSKIAAIFTDAVPEFANIPRSRQR